MTLKTLRLAASLLLTAVMVTSCSRASTPPPPSSAAAPGAATESAPAAAPEPPKAAPRSEVAPRDLSQDERAGGHTLSRHIGRTDAQLRERLRDEPGISAASTWNDRDTAERVIAMALTAQRAKVQQWSDRSGSRPNLALNYHDRGDEPIGRSISRRGNGSEPCHDAVIVLKWRGDSFYVLTSYPEARR